MFHEWWKFHEFYEEYAQITNSGCLTEVQYPDFKNKLSTCEESINDLNRQAIELK